VADLTLDPRTTALVLIDLQNRVVSMPVAPRSGQDVVAAASKLLEAFRSRGALVVLVRVAFHDGRDLLQPQADEPSPLRAGELPPDWAELVPQLAPRPGELVITKHQWGAFYGTELDLQLRRRGIRTIVLSGIATNIGVESTARDAYERGYEQVFVEDAMADRSGEAHAFVVKTVFPRIGRVRSTADVVAALQR
jgi:nicotinamidase-related amidase